MIGLVPRKAMRSIIQTDLMILLQKKNFCTSPTEHFEKVKGKIQEMSHHLHKLIYLFVWNCTVGGRTSGNKLGIFLLSLLNDVYCLQKTVI